MKQKKGLFNLIRRLRPIGPTGPRHRTAVVQKRHQRGIVDDNPSVALADVCGFHAVAEDFLRHAERWRRVRFTKFERRQIEAVRQELDAEYEASDTTSPASQKPRPAAEIPSNSWT